LNGVAHGEENSRTRPVWQPAAPNRTVDGAAGEAYSSGIVKVYIYRVFAILAVTAFCGDILFAEDLDAALAAQKKKAQRSVYSETAQLDDLKLEVPRSPTKEDQALDRKLQEIEARLDARPAPDLRQPAVPSPAAVAPPVRPKNWLVPAQMDDEAAMMQTNETGNTWLSQELERQKALKAYEAALKESELIEKLLHEKTQPQGTSPELNRLKQYDLPSQPVLPGRKTNKDDAAPSYMMPQIGSSEPKSSIRPVPKTGRSPVAPVFSPTPSGSSSIIDPFAPASSKPAIGSNFGSAPDSRPDAAASLNYTDSAPLSPLEIIRKSSPINRDDPFAPSHLPQMKGSIWE
jgi:hypothetical protein